MRRWTGTLVAIVGVVALGLPGAAAAAPVITEFDTGFTNDNGAWDIAAGPDGNLWVTEEAVDKVARITPAGVVDEFSTGLTAGSPRGITTGPDGNLWFAEHGGAIGQITTAGVITEYTTGLSGDAKPADIAAGADGNLWFTEDTPARIGKIDPNTGTIAELTTGLTSGSQPNGITAGPDGNLWFAENAGSGAIGNIDPATGTIIEFTAGLTTGSKPLDITVGPDGNLWFTEFANPGAVGRITPSGAITEFGDLTSNAAPTGIAAGPDGALWLTGSANAGRVVRMTTTGSVTEYTAGLTGNRKPWRIAAGPSNTMWLTQNGNPGSVARVSGIDVAGGNPGGGIFTPAPVSSPFPPPLVPQLGSSVVVRPARGVVRVRRRGASSFVPLTAGAKLPVGSEVDARRGTLALTSALPGGREQTGTFGGGRFQFKQPAHNHGRVDLFLRGRVCSRPAASGASASAARRRVVRRLWGRDHGGRFRTHGRSSHATVRGTRWLVEDRCGGTLTRVTRGSVVVRDLVRHKRVVVRAGKSYLARRHR